MRKIVATMMLGWLALQTQAADLTWTTDLPAAQKQAKTEKKMVLMNFTGSDWCSWCKKLDKEVFSTPEFQEYARKNLVLVEVDFPNQKEQTAALKKANASLKKQYGATGFPTIVALNADGKQVWKQPGYLRGGPSAFIAKLEEAKKK